MSAGFSFHAEVTTDSNRKMWNSYAEFRIQATRHDVRKMLWRLIAILALNAAFFAVTRSVIFIGLILLAFPLFAIFMRLSYRRARKAKFGIEKWLEEGEFENQKLSYTISEESISWKTGKESTEFAWKDCVYSHDEDGVFMVFDGKSKLLFLISREICGMYYNQVKEVAANHTKELLSKSIL